MEGKIPIILEDKLCGAVTVSRAGAMTVFEAECLMQPGILRLSLYGGGREAYLGVMMPGEDGKLHLRKKLSRDAMRSFPESLDHAGVPGEKPEEDRPQEAFAPEAEDKEEPAQPETKTGPELCGPEAEELYWYSSPDGALVCFDGERSLIALPDGDERIPAEFSGTPKSIEGKTYLVYITKNGRIVG